MKVFWENMGTMRFQGPVISLETFHKTVPEKLMFLLTFSALNKAEEFINILV